MRTGFFSIERGNCDTAKALWAFERGCVIANQVSFCTCHTQAGSKMHCIFALNTFLR
ncbi:MAG: hypothetical protein ACYDEC_05500 [Bacteroidia bacterium]